MKDQFTQIYVKRRTIRQIFSRHVLAYAFGDTTRRSHLDEPVMGHFSRITFHFPGFIILGFKRLKRYENLKYEQFQKILERLLSVVLILLVLYTVIDNRCWLYRQFTFFENETAWQIAEIFG